MLSSIFFGFFYIFRKFLGEFLENQKTDTPSNFRLSPFPSSLGWHLSRCFTVVLVTMLSILSQVNLVTAGFRSGDDDDYVGDDDDDDDEKDKVSDAAGTTALLLYRSPPLSPVSHPGQFISWKRMLDCAPQHSQSLSVFARWFGVLALSRLGCYLGCGHMTTRIPS